VDINAWLDISPFDWPSVGAALLCGCVVGLERQLRGKPVGIRTSALIVLGTYLFVAAADSLQGSAIDPTRIIGQVVTGVGFLGAGVMMTRDGTVLGVTSAASIWVLAALGVCVAISNGQTAIKLAFLVVSILYGVDLLEKTTHRFTRGVHARFESISRNHHR